MDAFAIDDFLDLTDRAPAPSVSLFVPVQPRPSEVNKVRTQVKNLLRTARTRLIEELQLRPGEAGSVIAAMQERFESTGPWPHHARGLALFGAPGIARLHWLPVEVQEFLAVGVRFHVRPLLPLVAGEHAEFTVLALSQQQVRLFEGSRFAIHELHPQDLPTSLQEAVTASEHEQSLQWHTSSPSMRLRMGRTPRGIFHGNAGGATTDTHALSTFFRAVDRAVCAAVVRAGQHPAPLVLACVEHYLPLYRAVSAHPDLVDDVIAGSPELLGADELRQRAYEIVAPREAAREHQATARLHEASAHGRAATGLDAVLTAARNARVAELFVAANGAGGTARPQRIEQELLDVAATETLRHRGRVHVLPPERLEGRRAAAVLRY